ncbi:MAG: type II toxin-antitoxin system Phd/YefM family antitoxin [Candidatus Eremiobacteraeota bacterium]|nr:type II toxin-antitoxin system Phd/YefM family antitoxin [Candidatus Eremiobacteraeota bacterium]MCL5054693.1 type II toxin-antitoxin system Phd/YefM family antitoxin [Bacillota bacterium]
MSIASPQFIVNQKGKRTAVILDKEEYDALLEDLHDLLIIAERRSEPTISFSKVKRRLKKDGLL